MEHGPAQKIGGALIPKWLPFKAGGDSDQQPFVKRGTVSGSSCRIKVLWFRTNLPFDIAANAGGLVC